MGGVGGCELVLAHCWVLEQQAPCPWGWGCCFWSPRLVKLHLVGGWMGCGLLFENCIVDASILFFVAASLIALFPLGWCVRCGDAENDILVIFLLI